MQRRTRNGSRPTDHWTSATPSLTISRRGVLRGAGLLGLGITLGRLKSADAGRQRGPGSLPHPRLPEGTDTLPQIENIVIVMMENHSFDNYLGLLNRGDGLRTANGVPTASNPVGDGSVVHAFHMPSACQLNGHPGQ